VLPLLFSAVNLTDDDKRVSRRADIHKLGTTSLNISQLESCNAREVPDEVTGDLSWRKLVSSSALHRILTATKSSYDYTPYAVPYGTFEFRDHPLGALRA